MKLPIQNIKCKENNFAGRAIVKCSIFYSAEECNKYEDKWKDGLVAWEKTSQGIP
jgi:hypothetical protein